jgi:tRNA-specific 2-thiouridylase
MGKYHKDEIKRLAIDLGYESLAKKSESYEICFIPDNDYRSFLKRRVKGLEEKVQNGDFLNTSGEVIGKHDGYPFFTIGQRKLGKSFGKKPSYVIGIDPSNNTVTIGSKQDLDKQIMHVRDVNFGKLSAIKDGTKCLVKIRYKHVGEIATIFNVDKNLKIVFHKHVKGIAPGQSAVLYSGDDVIAGGFII